MSTLSPPAAPAGDRVARAVEHAIERLDPVGEAGTRAARAVHRAVLAGGERTRSLADALHGTWLGHPLHPVLTDVTVGAWVLGAAFDAVGELADDEFFRRAGDTLAAIGTASAIPTAVSGLSDFSAIKRPAATAGTLHALMNAAGTVMFLKSLRDRKRGRRGAGLAWSFGALALSGASAWLGGHLVYKHRVGVTHRDEFDGTAGWVPVLDAAELPDRAHACVEYEGKPVLLHREGGNVHAIGAVCSHAGGPLDEGDIDGHTVRCPWHDSVFDLRDGHVVHGPATMPQVAFAARVRDGRVEIRA